MRVRNQRITSRGADRVNRTVFVSRVEHFAMAIGVFVHIREDKTMGGRHERTTGPITLEGFRSGHLAEVRIPGAINVNFGPQSGESGLFGDHESVHLAL